MFSLYMEHHQISLQSPVLCTLLISDTLLLQKKSPLLSCGKSDREMLSFTLTASSLNLLKYNCTLQYLYISETEFYKCGFFFHFLHVVILDISIPRELCNINKCNKKDIICFLDYMSMLIVFLSSYTSSVRNYPGKHSVKMEHTIGTVAFPTQHYSIQEAESISSVQIITT